MAGFSWSLLLGLIGIVLKPLLKAMTPQIEEEFEKLLLGFYKKTLSTPNPVDDLLMKFVLEIFDIDVPE